MLTKGEEYTDQGQDYYEERYRERVLRQLALRAEKMGMKLVASEQTANSTFTINRLGGFLKRRFHYYFHCTLRPFAQKTILKQPQGKSSGSPKL